MMKRLIEIIELFAYSLNDYEQEIIITIESE